MKSIFQKFIPKQVQNILKGWLKFLTHKSQFRTSTEKIIENNYHDRIADNDKVYNFIVNKYLYRLPAEYNTLLTGSLKNLLASDFNEKFYAEIQQALIDKTSALDSSFLNPQLWKDLQYLAIRFGMFQCSKIFRDKAFEAASNRILKKNANVSEIADAFKAAMDESDEAMAMNMIRAAERLGRKPLVEEMLFYYMLCMKNQTSNMDFMRVLTQKIDKNYYGFLNGKSIAIVGPAVTLENNGPEIDSHDVVVRLGYKGKRFNPEEKKFGERTDISYYGNANVQLYITKKSSEFLKDLEWAVFKSSRFMKHAYEISEEKKRCFKTNTFYFSGSPSMMQNAVFDILHFKPGKVKLFNTNFNCAKVTHYKEYRPNEEELRSFLQGGNYPYCKIRKMKNLVTAGFAHHDLLSQLNFTRNLWGHGAIEVDKDCERVLRMENGEYLIAMENFHVKPYLSN